MVGRICPFLQNSQRLWASDAVLAHEWRPRGALAERRLAVAKTEKSTTEEASRLRAERATEQLAETRRTLVETQSELASASGAADAARARLEAQLRDAARGSERRVAELRRELVGSRRRQELLEGALELDLFPRSGNTLQLKNLKDTLGGLSVPLTLLGRSRAARTAVVVLLLLPGEDCRRRVERQVDHKLSA